MAPKEIELTVSFDPDGHYTLIERSGRAGAPDLPRPLVGNSDKAQFYRELARYIARRAAEGVSVHCKNATPRLE